MKKVIWQVRELDGSWYVFGDWGVFGPFVSKWAA
jgi:hypothetical protein